MSSIKSSNTWPLQVAEPEEVGFSSERLAQIRPAMQRYIDEQKLPCMITLVARYGKIVHFEAQGYLDIESKRPVPKDAFFRLFSNSKPITGVAAMILYEEGLLDLNDPISRFLPAFKNPKVSNIRLTGEDRQARTVMMPYVPARREITVRDCLRNTTGLATARRLPIQTLTQQRDIIVKAGLLPATDGEASSLSIRERVENLAQLPLDSHPGTEWEYHIGYPVIGAVLEIASGMNLEDFYRERIFEPLKMKDTSFYLPDGRPDRFTSSYRPQRDGQEFKLVVVDRAETSEKVIGPKTFFGAGGDRGGLLSTVADYARFAQMLLNGGELDGVRILGRKTVELMTSSHTGTIPIPMLGRGFGFGIGVGVRTGIDAPPHLRSVGVHFWGGAAGTGHFVDPKEDMFAIYFTQIMGGGMIPGGSYSMDFERLVYQALT